MTTRYKYAVLVQMFVGMFAALSIVNAATVGDLIGQLGGDDEQARAVARQLLPREDAAVVVPRLLPLLVSEKAAVWSAARNVIADLINEASVAGREAERSAAAASLMTLLAPSQPQPVKVRVLRLLAVAVPEGQDVAPVAALLADAELKDKARSCLEEMNTTAARAALRAYLPKADVEFACAILNSLTVLRDAESIELIRALATAADPRLRAAAVRALAWNGSIDDLPYARKLLSMSGSEPGSVSPVQVGAGLAPASQTPARTSVDALDAYLRFVYGMSERGGNWDACVAEYVGLLKSSEPLAVEAGLAGLGRMGDGSCVGPILEATKNAEGRTWLMGVNALRTMFGVDTTRAIVEAFPSVSPKLQVALVPVLAGRKHALAAPILKQAVESSDPALHMAGLTALGDVGLPDGVDLLEKYVTTGSDDEKKIARASLLTLADGLRAGNKPKEAKDAGRAYVLVYASAGSDEKDARRRAAEGLTACPVPGGYDAAKAIAADPATAADKDARELAIRLVIGVAASLTEANQKERALELYDLVPKLTPGPDYVQQVAKGMHAAGAKVDLGTLLGIVTNWWVVGPFELGEQNAGWNVKYVDEPNVNLVAKYMTGKRRVQWTPLVSAESNGRIDLRKTVADTDMAIGYAYTEITVKDATKAVLLVGSDDSERIWLNGQQVFETWQTRAMTADQDKVPVKLQAGTNKLLLKVWQHTLGWEFCVRITLPDGRPLQFTQKTQ